MTRMMGRNILTFLGIDDLVPPKLPIPHLQLVDKTCVHTNTPSLRHAALSTTRSFLSPSLTGCRTCLAIQASSLCPQTNRLSEFSQGGRTCVLSCILSWGRFTRPAQSCPTPRITQQRMAAKGTSDGLSSLDNASRRVTRSGHCPCHEPPQGEHGTFGSFLGIREAYRRWHDTCISHLEALALRRIETHFSQHNQPLTGNFAEDDYTTALGGGTHHQPERKS